MVSFRAKMFRVILRNRHLLKGQLKKPVIDFNTSMEELREDVRKGAAKTKVPESIKIVPADFPLFYAEWLIPENAREDKMILYFHGSGFVMGTSKEHRALVGKFCERCGYKALVFDYSLAPEHPFPAAVNESVALYEWLLSKGYKQQNILFAGDSAGGCIEFSTMLVLKDKGIALPKAVVAFSPCTDLTASGDSIKTRAKLDPAEPKGAGDTYRAYYIADGDPKDPYMSPLFGDLAGFPPIMIQVGDYETLLDDSVRFAKKAEAAGVDVKLHIWDGMFHCFPLLAPMFPEAIKAMDETCEFVREQLG